MSRVFSRSVVFFLLLAIAFALDSPDASMCAAAEGAPSKEHPAPLFFFENALRTPGAQGTFTLEEYEARVRQCREMGYAGAEVSVGPDFAQKKAILLEQGLKPFATYVGIRVNDPENPFVPGLREAIEGLKGTGAVVNLYLLGVPSGQEIEKNDPIAVRHIRQVADWAAESGLKVALYPHAFFYVDKVEDAVRLIQKADRPNLGLIFNLCHWLKVQGPGDLDGVLQAAKPYLYCVSVNGADAGGQDWDALIRPLGEGDFDVAIVVKKVREIGYTGPFGLQCYNINLQPEDHLGRSIRAWKTIWADSFR